MPRESRVVYRVRARPAKSVARRVGLALLGLVGLGVLGGGLWYVVNLPSLRVGRIEVRGAQALSAPDVEQAVREVLAGTAWGIPADSFFALSGERIEHRLAERFSGIEEIDVDRRFPDRLVITIAERTLWGVYCARIPGEAPGPCAYLDTHGVAYEELSGFEGWLLPVIYGPQAAASGRAAAPEATLRFYQEAESALAAVGGDLLAMSMGTTTPQDVRLRLAEGWELWVTMGRPAGEWSGVLETVLEREIGARRGELDYTDLRFGAKVFYKFR